MLNSYVYLFPLGIHILTRLQQWKDISIAIAKIAHAKGLLESDQVDKIIFKEATAMHPWDPILWGRNSRGSRERLKALGWKSNGKDLLESLPDMVDAGVGKQGTGQKLTFTQRMCSK
jgi:hypothetical protein